MKTKRIIKKGVVIAGMTLAGIMSAGGIAGITGNMQVMAAEETEAQVSQGAYISFDEPDDAGKMTISGAEVLEEQEAGDETIIPGAISAGAEAVQEQAEVTVTETEATEKQEITDAKTSTAPEEGSGRSFMAKDQRNGWQTISGSKYYYVNGVKQTGWKNIDGAWYYLGQDGRMRTGWQQIGKGTSNPDKDNAKHWSYFGDDGKLRTGWQKMGKGTSNPDKDSAVHWSYFGDNGWLRTGWQKMGKGTSNPDKDSAVHWSYFGDNGWLRTGWQKMGKGTSNPDKNSAQHWSYFGDNGWLRTGWQEIGKGTNNPDKNNAKHWSYFGDNGWLRTGWQKMGKGTSNPDKNSTQHWSYFGDNGWLRTGWQQMGKGTNNPDKNNAKHWSYFGPNGWLRTELQQMGKGTSNPDGNAAKHLSYFGSNGWLRVNQIVTVNGKNYNADSRGWLTEISAAGLTKAQKINNEYNSMVQWISGFGLDFNELGNLHKARLIVMYIAEHFSHKGDDCGSYTAESMIDKRYGTCYGFADLTRELALKAGIKDVWLTVPGRMVDHGVRMYGSLHKTAVAYIDGSYYDLDSDSVGFNWPMIKSGIITEDIYPIIEKISKSYADYLRGVTNSYTSIY